MRQEHCSPRKKPENSKRPCYALHLVMIGRGALIDGAEKNTKSARTTPLYYMKTKVTRTVTIYTIRGRIYQ